MRRLAVVGGAVLLAGCAAGAPAAPPEPGVQLVLDVTNASVQDRSVGYEYDFGNGSGGAETFIDGCRRMAINFGSLAGGAAVTASRILLDGKPVSDVDMPRVAIEGAHVVIRMRIGPAGEVEVDRPVVVREAPPEGGAAIPGC